ncbi:carboxypeptidase-like regulatory domain-containing protein [Flavobacterium sp. TBRC 19031]|uniref:carboxypeptidase-like regulatory domain-containing protein n=1 Tax=Flavobacterium mekongense TaxID=3379707 RepID=UPI003999ECE9
MKRIGLLTFLIFNVNLVIGQVKGVVVDENNKPIPYVNIWVENENIGTTSNDNGFFIINASEGKRLVFSAVGFESKIISIKNEEKVVLKTAVFKLDEILIIKRKQDKELEIGNAERIHHRQLSGDKPWIYGKLFPYDSAYNSTPYLKKIIFYSDCDIKEAKIKIRIFDFNNTIPTNDLLPEDLIVTVKRGKRKNTIDIAKYHLRFPEKGIVIGLEWMIIEENRHDFVYKDTKSKKTVTMENYQPSLVVNYSQEAHSFNYSQGKWIRNKKFVIENNNDKPWFNTVMLPAINLILTN